MESSLDLDYNSMTYTLAIKYLANGTYDDCTITPYDYAYNTGNTMNIPSFIINISPTATGSLQEDTFSLLFGDPQKNLTLNITSSELLSGYQEYLDSGDEEVLLSSLEFS